MPWFITATRWWVVLAVCILTGLVAGLWQGATASMPNLSRGALTPVPVVAVVGLAPSVMLTWSWSRLPLESLAGVVRPMQVVLVAMVVVSCATYTLSAWSTGGTGAALEALRNACGLMGLALLGRFTWGERGAVLLPVGYLLAAFAVGRPGGGLTPSWWAWILTEGAYAPGLVLAAALLAAGLAVTPALPGATARAA